MKFQINEYVIYKGHKGIVAACSATDTDCSYLIRFVDTPPSNSWMLEKGHNMATWYDEKYLGEFFYWAYEPMLTKINFNPTLTHKNYHCVECNYGDHFTTESNLSEDRFICYSCKDSYSWKYKDSLK